MHAMDDDEYKALSQESEVKARKSSSKSAKRGNPRKSRLPRLSTSFMWGSSEFEPTEDDWRRIETAYPFLSSADRDEISRIATNYLMHVPFEPHAPKVADTVAWLDDGKKAAETFLTAWHKWPSTDDKAFAANYA
jgi:hypothetical protein